jgi:hypothetical protein
VFAPRLGPDDGLQPDEAICALDIAEPYDS